jgi:hypothetical protein
MPPVASINPLVTDPGNRCEYTGHTLRDVNDDRAGLARSAFRGDADTADRLVG